MNLDDTIAAIATPVGEGGLGVIRVSGLDAHRIAAPLFCRKGGKPGGPLESHRLYFGTLRGATGPVDEVCVVYMQSPRSYTRQDMVEISCHGSPAVLRRALNMLLGAGARMAEPGEFTKRAFLSGRIDLSQAEGVIDLIKARSEGAARAAFGLMEGGLSQRIEAVRQKLVWTLSHLEASIDFPDEEFVTATDDELRRTLSEAARRLDVLIKSYDGGRFLKHGLSLAIIGKPNAGKSSLLNALLEEERAIVSGVPGTTRDLIRAEGELAGLKVELIDTAGLNPAPDAVEAEGIRRALKAAETADAVIGLFDGARAWEESDTKVLEVLKKARLHLAVINKSDMPQQIAWPDAAVSPVHISVKEMRGLDQLLKKIAAFAHDAHDLNSEEPVVTRLRHREIFCRIAEDLRRAADEVALGRELAAASVWDALEEIKRFTGESYTEEVLSAIFDEFCVGK
ncbi:MAG: tRNA uridine-5-carboxymethylaminomethyl(34) synthesis GTPase MnmE [Nitrospinae bacterium]|nr:tRNA uridine-5-carboxymethylaminomethyl(34) synthesis GTPase MnmE [Nitrospinota bacterium]